MIDEKTIEELQVLTDTNEAKEVLIKVMLLY